MEAVQPACKGGEENPDPRVTDLPEARDHHEAHEGHEANAGRPILGIRSGTLMTASFSPPSFVTFVPFVVGYPWI